jgi:hypothetical protein
MTTEKLGNLSARCMIARLSISAWTARKLDRAASSKTTTDAGARSDAARVNKFLLAGNDAQLKAIGTIATQARSDFYALTAPWTDNGDRILTSDAWSELNKRLQAHSLAYAQAVDTFILGDYASARAKARDELGSLFSDADFPAPWQVRRRFDFDFAFDALPASADFRVDLADEDAEIIRADIEARTERRLAAAVSSVWQRLAESLQHAADTMTRLDTGEQKRLFGSVVGNVREIAAQLPALNLTRDPAMDAVAARVLATLGTVETETLKTDSQARAQVRTAATSILADIAALTAPPMLTPEEIDESLRLADELDHQLTTPAACVPNEMPWQLFTDPVRGAA